MWNLKERVHMNVFTKTEVESHVENKLMVYQGMGGNKLGGWD